MHKNNPSTFMDHNGNSKNICLPFKMNWSGEAGDRLESTKRIMNGSMFPENLDRMLEEYIKS